MKESELRDMLWRLCEAQAQLTASAVLTGGTLQRADRDKALEQIVSAVNHDRDAITAVTHTDDAPAVFFRRGNACVSWDRVPEDMRWVTVDRNGKVYASERDPVHGDNGWTGFLGMFKQVAAVGRDCADWESLIFERPQPLPVITAEEWQHIRWMMPGAAVVAKDKNGIVYAYDAPIIIRQSTWGSDGNVMFVQSLDERFKDIPWRESAVYYEEDNDAK